PVHGRRFAHDTVECAAEIPVFGFPVAPVGEEMGPIHIESKTVPYEPTLLTHSRIGLHSNSNIQIDIMLRRICLMVDCSRDNLPTSGTRSLSEIEQAKQGIMLNQFSRRCVYLTVLLFTLALLPTNRSAATDGVSKPTLILIS